MGLSYQDAQRLGIGHLHPAASGKGVNDVLRDLGVEIEPTKPSKYKAVRTEYCGVWFASKAEAKRAEQLTTNQMVRWWIGQPRFRLGVPENVYVADFLVVDIMGDVRVEDVKGVATAKFKRDLKLWRKYGPCPLWVITGSSIQVIDPEGTKEL